MRKFTIIIVILDVIALVAVFLFYGPVSNIRTWWINTSMNTMSHKYFAYIFYNDKMIEKTMNENYYVPLTDQVDLDSIIIDTEPKYTYENEYDKEILIREEGNNDYKLIETKVGNYDAFLVAIYDPSKIHVVTKTKLGTGAYGENMVSMCKRTKSKVCINAGRFKQDSHGLSSDYPVGYIIKDSEIIWATDSNRKGELIGFNKDNKLVLTKATGVEALEMGIRDAVEFGPFLIINGEPQNVSGVGGGLNPRTAIGQTADGTILFLVIDGRQVNSIGASFADLQEIMIEHGAINASTMDGGTSSQLYYNGEVISVPYSPSGPRRCPTAFLIK